MNIQCCMPCEWFLKVAKFQDCRTSIQLNALMYLCLSRCCGLNKSGFRPRVRDDVPPPLSQHPHGVGSLCGFKVPTRPSYHYDAAKVQLFFELCKRLVKKEKIYNKSNLPKGICFGNYIYNLLVMIYMVPRRPQNGVMPPRWGLH